MHKKWVFFYTVVLLALIFFALIAGGIIKTNIPSLNVLKPSPEKTITKIQALCKLEKYDSVALQSLKYENGKYSLVTRQDVLGTGSSGGYLFSAKNVCNMVNASRKVEKKEITKKLWEYKYYAAILFDSNQTLSILYFDNDWRLVLPSGMKY